MDAVALNKLKLKTADEYYKLICKVLKGYRPDYEFILEEISFIEMIENCELEEQISKNALQYYLNNKWQIIQS